MMAKVVARWDTASALQTGVTSLGKTPWWSSTSKFRLLTRRKGHNLQWLTGANHKTVKRDALFIVSNFFLSKTLIWHLVYSTGHPRWLRDKGSTCQCRRCGFNPWVGKIPWRRKWQPTPELLPGKSQGQGRLVGYSPFSQLNMHTCIQY